MLIQRNCPNCHQPHGVANWRVANSSLIRPLRCKNCNQFFHQTGFKGWVLGWLIFPTGLIAAILSAILATSSLDLSGLHIKISIIFLAAFIESLLIAAYVNRRYPLATGPKHG